MHEKYQYNRLDATLFLPFNYDSLSVFLTTIKKNIEIVILTETWFTKDSCCNIEGYTGYHCFRAEISGRGVSVFVS